MSISLFGPLNTGAATGGSGVATANATSSQILTGRVLGVYVKYNDSPPAGTTDVSVATTGTRHPATTILTRTNTATSGWFYPALQLCDTSGTAITGAYDGILISDQVKVTIAQADNADNVDVWLLLGGI